MRTYTFYYTLNDDPDLKIYFFRSPSLSGAVKSLCLLLDNYGDRLSNFEYYYRVTSCSKTHLRRLPDKYYCLLSSYIDEVLHEN